MSNSLVPFEPEIQEIEHLCNDWRGRFRKVPERIRKVQSNIKFLDRRTE